MAATPLKIEQDVIQNLFPNNPVRNVIERVINQPKGAKHWARNTNNVTFDFLDRNFETLANKTYICFARLRSQYQESEGVRYLRYAAQVPDEKVRKAAPRWIELCIELGIFKTKQSPEEILEEGLLIDLEDERNRVGNTYAFLCLLRWLDECPELTIGVLDLVDNAGRDFWAALVFCHTQFGVGGGHSFIPVDSVYGGGTGMSRSLGLVLKLHELVHNPDVVDSRKITEELKSSNAGNFWQTQSLLSNKLGRKYLLKNREMILSSELFPVIMAESKEKVHEMVEEINNRNGNVKFESVGR